jgi:hypothetical protein
MNRSFECSLPFRFSNQNFVRISPLSHAGYMSHPWRSVQNMKLRDYAVFTTLPPLLPSFVQIFSSLPCSQMPSIYVLPLV